MVGWSNFVFYHGSFDKWVNGSARTGNIIDVSDHGKTLKLVKSSGETFFIDEFGVKGDMANKSVFEIKDFCKSFGPRGEIAFKRFVAFVEKMCKR